MFDFYFLQSIVLLELLNKLTLKIKHSLTGAI